MQTIILCGGRGWRMQEETEYKPKALVKIGGLPILLHIMNMYARFGHYEFLLCLGYKGDMIRDYFLHIDKYSQDICLDLSTGQYHQLKKSRSLPYKISFIDTGENTDTAARVLIASKYIIKFPFFVSYGDDVSNVNFDKLLQFHQRQILKNNVNATITAAHPSSHYGKIWADKRNMIRKFSEKPDVNDYVNGGFMVFEKKALRYLRRGETLEEGLERMANSTKLAQYKHEDFWHAMNTMKDVHYLNKLSRTKPWLKNPKK